MNPKVLRMVEILRDLKENNHVIGIKAAFEKILRKYYPKFNISNISPENIIYYLKHDKKRTGKDLTMILLESLGKAQKYDDINEREGTEVFNIFSKNYLDS